MAGHGTFASARVMASTADGGEDAPGVVGGVYATPRLTGFQQTRMRRGKISVFTLTFLSYVSFHCTRKIFSVIKGSVRSYMAARACWFARQYRMCTACDTCPYLPLRVAVVRRRVVWRR